MTITLPNGSDTTALPILGAISTKGRAPLVNLVEGFIRRRHHHPAGTRCVELREPEPETEPTSPPATPDWLPAPIQDPALGDETPTDTTVAIGDLTGTEDGYIGRHRDPHGREADWTPAHTRAAARHRAQLQHVRADGQRPDLRIEQTVGLSIERIQQMLAGGAA